ncbi:MAG: thioredoxin domain-containing protein [Candidatus Saccharimonadales bacterium]
MNKRTIGIVLGIILAAVGFWYLTKPAPESTAEPTNHVKEGSSGVVFIEYGDFQCSACAAYHPILQEVKARYKGIVTFQFRHFPLEALHKNARAGSRAAEAAAAQGKFWEMHDYLFENQTAWQDASDPQSLFEGYAQAIDIADIEKFKTDYRSSEINALINADLEAGRALNIQSTPSFVLDGKKLEKNPGGSLAEFSALLDEAIKSKGGTPPASSTDATLPAGGSTEITPTQDPSAQ